MLEYSPDSRTQKTNSPHLAMHHQNQRFVATISVVFVITLGMCSSISRGQPVTPRKPNVVILLRGRYDAFVATLPPLKPSADYKGGGQVPKGWGWELGDGK